jgi:hypothetical protein
MNTQTPRVGRVFSRLTVKRLDESKSSTNDKFYVCVCTCGNTCSVRWSALTKGDKRSCGCLAAERAKAYKYTAADKAHELFQTWRTMVRRCHSPNYTKFCAYGAKGISVCEAWRDSFHTFLQDMGPRPSPEYSLDRINNNGNYEPGNVRWATSLEQQVNRPQRSPYIVTIGGKSKTLYSLCKAAGVDRRTVVDDIKKGRTPEVAFVAALLRKQLYAESGPQTAEAYEACYTQAELRLQDNA